MMFIITLKYVLFNPQITEQQLNFIRLANTKHSRSTALPSPVPESSTLVLVHTNTTVLTREVHLPRNDGTV
jgi:hypothetical protein